MMSLMSCFENSDKDQPAKYIWNSEGIYQDVEGDAVFEFVDLTKLKVAIDDEKISINISLSHIPYMLIFNHTDVPASEVEYEWAVYFAIDGTSTNEISISMNSFKIEDSRESLGSILINTQRDVWLVDTEGGKNVSSNVVATGIDRTTFSLSVNKNEHEALKKITTKTPVRFSAEYNFAGKVCKDFFPDT
jgi:hypothetical protein